MVYINKNLCEIAECTKPIIMHRLTLISSLFCLLLMSCAEEKISTTIVSGTIADGAGTTLTLGKYNGAGYDNSLTAETDANGHFEFQVQDDSINYYRLSVSEKNFLLLILSPNEKVEVTGPKDELFKSYKVSGSEHSEIAANFFHAVDDITEKMRSHQETFQLIPAANDAEKEQIQKAMDKIKDEYNAYVYNFVDQNSTSPAVVVAASYLRNPEADLPFFKKMQEGLGQTVPGSVYHKQIGDQVKSLERQVAMMEQQKLQQAEQEKFLKIGETPPEIKLANPEGKQISLHAQKGSVVLLDFWASWCRPCRMENPNVVKLYEKYKNQGFDIFSVSLDQNAEQWTNAIKTDKLTWPNHVCDFGGWQSEPAQAYKLSGIPFTVLLDKEGNVIAKNLRGPALEKKLEEIFG